MPLVDTDHGVREMSSLISRQWNKLSVLDFELQKMKEKWDEFIAINKGAIMQLSIYIYISDLMGGNSTSMKNSSVGFGLNPTR